MSSVREVIRRVDVYSVLMGASDHPNRSSFVSISGFVALVGTPEMRPQNPNMLTHHKCV